MDAIPVVTSQQLRTIDNLQVKEHFRKSVDGKRTLIDIAEKMGKDPLKVAQNYLNWNSNGWVNFVTSPIEVAKPVARSTVKSDSVSPSAVNTTVAGIDRDLPTVLSVDDSAIIQTTIKRALQEDYNILLAGKSGGSIKHFKRSSG